MNNKIEMMIDDIVMVTGYLIRFNTPDGMGRVCSIWVSEAEHFASYEGDTFLDALEKAWQELCG